MTVRTVAVKLKIPDNEAYTAFTALQRLGVSFSRLERAVIWQMHDEGFTDFAGRFAANETLFNPNKHEMELLQTGTPRAGEVWIEDLDGREFSTRMTGVSRARRYIAWRLFAAGGQPADAATVKESSEKLLCNPAIERALTA